jgi:hypothetical protein
MIRLLEFYSLHLILYPKLISLSSYLLLLLLLVVVVVVVMLLQLSFHLVAVVLTVAQIKQIRINLHERKKKKNTNETIPAGKVVAKIFTYKTNVRISNITMESLLYSYKFRRNSAIFSECIEFEPHFITLSFGTGTRCGAGG